MKTQWNTPWMRAAGVAAALLTAAAGEARAQWSLTPYVWTAGLDAKVALDGSTVVDQHIGFTELVEDVDIAAMVRLEGQFGAWGTMLDLFYIGMSTSGDQLQLPNGAPATIASDIGMAIVDATASYGLAGGPMGLALVAGTRVLVERTQVTLDVATSPTTTQTQVTETTDVQVNGIVGLRYRRRLTSRLSMDARGDVGTGGTKLTWSGGSEMAYAFGASQRFAFRFGYRRLSVDFHDEGSVQSSMAMSGFVTGFRIAF